MKWKIKVNRNVLDRNRAKNRHDPPLTAVSSKGAFYGDEILVCDKQGNPVLRVVYNPSKPLPCGAHVWIETCKDAGSVEIRNQGQDIAMTGAAIKAGKTIEEYLAEAGMAGLEVAV